MSVSERLAQEDRILREIRLSLSSFRTLDSAAPRRRGAVYASAPITSGFYLYDQMGLNGFVSAAEFRKAMPELFHRKVFLRNLEDGRRFGEYLRRNGWPQVIVPGRFFADGWTQEHYMSLWRQVIVRHARTIALCRAWQFSLGCTEEFVIGLQHGKTLLDHRARPLLPMDGLQLIREAIDGLDKRGFEVKPHYELWRQATLTWEAQPDTE